jgi:hypothetical protein
MIKWEEEYQEGQMIWGTEKRNNNIENWKLKREKRKEKLRRGRKKEEGGRRNIKIKKWKEELRAGTLRFKREMKREEEY